MPHEVETMMFAGETPWHRLGKEVAGLQTAREAVAVAGLDWEVELLPIYTKNGEYVEITESKAVTRKTDHRVYGIVGSRYVPIQNNDAFQFFDQVIGTGKAVYETAGSLQGGKRIWILANLKGSIEIAGDEIKRYLLLTNSHDGSMALQMFWTPIRVVCWNTLQSAFASAGTRFYSKHTFNARHRIDAAQEILGLSIRFYDKWLGQAQRLVQYQLSAGEMPKLLAASFGLTRADEVISAVLKPQIEKAEELIYIGRGQENPKIQGTAWQAFNGIAEFVDHYRIYRNGNTDESRLRGLLFGSGAGIKARTWDYLIKKAV